MLSAETSNNFGTVGSDAQAGGFAADVRANSTATDQYNTQATVGINACISAANNVTIAANTDGTGYISSYADGRGFGGGGYADSTLTVPVGMGLTQTQIMNGANVSGQRVVVGATSTNVNLATNSQGYGAGFWGESDDDSETKITAQNLIHVYPLACVEGPQGVDFLADFNGWNSYAYTFAEVTGLFGHLTSEANNNTNLTTTVTADSTALIIAGPRSKTDTFLQHPASPQPDPIQADPKQLGLTQLALFVDTSNTIIRISRGADHSKRALASGGDSGSTTNTQAASIPWNANVRIVSNPALGPTLIINSNGSVTTDTGITYTISGNTIYVNDITNNGRGQVYFDAPSGNVVGGDNPNGSSGQIGVTGTTEATAGTWSFDSTLGAVKIINNSPMNLYINNINVVNQGTSAGYDVYLQGSTSGPIPLKFKIRTSVDPTLITIENLGGGPGTSLLAPGLILNGTINNPIGTTTIIDTYGNITSTNPRGVVGPDGRSSLIVTNILDIEAPNGSIGTLADRINVDLVQSLDTDLQPDAAHQGHRHRGRGNVYFDLQGSAPRPGHHQLHRQRRLDHRGQNIDVLLAGKLARDQGHRDLGWARTPWPRHSSRRAARQLRFI